MRQSRISASAVRPPAKKSSMMITRSPGLRYSVDTYRSWVQEVLQVTHKHTTRTTPHNTRQKVVDDDHSVAGVEVLGRHVQVLSTRKKIRLYKILLHFTALLRESIILLFLPPPAKPTLLQYYCKTIAQYTPPTDPFCLCHTPYNIGDGNIV